VGAGSFSNRLVRHRYRRTGAVNGDKALTIHLFAIENAGRLRNVNLGRLTEEAG
jgi:hypothetical protein